MFCGVSLGDFRGVSGRESGSIFGSGVFVSGVERVVMCGSGFKGGGGTRFSRFSAGEGFVEPAIAANSRAPPPWTWCRGCSL